MPLFFLIVLSIYLGGNIYVFVKALKAFSIFPTTITVLMSILFWICALSLVGVFLLRDVKLPLSLSHTMQWVGTGWMVFILYMVLMLICSDILGLFSLRIPYSFFIALSITCIILGIGYYRYLHPKTQVINIVINKSVDNMKNIKIVGISDIHLGYATNKRLLKMYVDKVNEQNPDLILIAGDLIDNSVTPVRLQKMEEELNELKAPLGVYMVPGNHEYISNIQASTDFIAETSIRLLKDESITLPNGIQIIGRDDRINYHRKSLSSLLQDTDPEKPSILLDHQPHELEEAEKNGIDLQFSGHTHRGQIWPLNWLTDKMFEVSYGLKQKGNTYIYVSSGLSLWGPPFRIGTVSELVIFNITFAS